MLELAVDVQNVVKTHTRGGTTVKVLTGVNLQIKKGETIFLAGPSGSGKTTLLSVIGCILSIDEGYVEILGQNMNKLNAQERSYFRRDRLGFVFQKFNLIRGLTVSENIGVPLMLKGMSKKIIRQRALDLIEMVGLQDKVNAQPYNLSGGQCQRVAIARALANNPDLILADEPTAALDAVNGYNIMELLHKLALQENKTVVVVTHDPRIFCFANCIYWLENGNIVEQKKEFMYTQAGCVVKI